MVTVSNAASSARTVTSVPVDADQALDSAMVCAFCLC